MSYSCTVEKSIIPGEWVGVVYSNSGNQPRVVFRTPSFADRAVALRDAKSWRNANKNVSHTKNRRLGS